MHASGSVFGLLSELVFSGGQRAQRPLVAAFPTAHLVLPASHKYATYPRKDAVGNRVTEDHTDSLQVTEP